MSKEDGGAAFPGGHGTMEGPMHGMSLRDYFAAAALQGLIAHKEWIPNEQEFGLSVGEAIANRAFIYADAIIAERNKP